MYIVFKEWILTTVYLRTILWLLLTFVQLFRLFIYLNRIQKISWGSFNHLIKFTIFLEFLYVIKPNNLQLFYIIYSNHQFNFKELNYLFFYETIIYYTKYIYSGHLG